MPSQFKITQPESTPARGDQPPGGKLSTSGVFARPFPGKEAADDFVPLSSENSEKRAKAIAHILQGGRIIE
jgi:hypothetical protein